MGIVQQQLSGKKHSYIKEYLFNICIKYVINSLFETNIHLWNLYIKIPILPHTEHNILPL
jgi:hypothetical protein